MKKISVLKREWLFREIENLAQKKVSKADIARELGVKPQYLNTVLNSDRGITDQFLDKFIERYNITHIDLCNATLAANTCLSDVTANYHGKNFPNKEPITSTGIPLSQVKAKEYATRSDEEIDRTISAMMERQLMEMYEEGRIYPRKAVEQLVASLQESNQKLLTENSELKAELRRMQLKLSDRWRGPEAEAKK